VLGINLGVGVGPIAGTATEVRAILSAAVSMSKELRRQKCACHNPCSPGGSAANAATCRFQISRICFGVILSCHLINSIFLACIAATLWASDDFAGSAEAIATVNGEPITAAQVEKTVQPQVQAMEDRLRQLRQGALNKLIESLLLEQAAKKEGTSVDEFLKKHVEAVTVPSVEVDRAYDGSRDQFPGILPAEAKYRIRRTMEDNARAAALRNLVASLRQQARITNTLASDILATLDAAAHEGPSIGNPDAAVTIIEFSDFECPYCRGAQPLLKRIRERWPGQVRHVFKHFPLERHQHAMQAARAAVCSGQQEQFWAMHERIFAANDLSEAALRAMAAGAGLRMTEFDRCMRSEQPEGHVRKDILIGRTAGVTGTPAFFVNRELVPASALESAVEKALGDGR
jgi:protein-disulfide isomerase